ncbi:LCP family protein [Clavibacter tessellarius]|uniref:LytR family transcriptional regulator n=1 Tax=Clavibacter tessellarius TaxID=31965 RepID=A0A154UZP2_9MICO|nr:LCP family protein [Clavibacter michiganensis]KZC94469.1 LytR family transcriptional regulator [Clavibacter michiganensis subsp. tessellarius]
MPFDDEFPTAAEPPSGAERSSRPGIARHGRLRAPSAARHVALVLTATVAVLAVSAVSVAAIAAWELSRTVSANSVDISDGAAIPPALGGLDGSADILLVGSDSRDGQGDGYGDPKVVGTGRLNDANVLVHVSADHTRATAISFPRDMLVDIPACKGEDGKPDVPGSTHVMLNTALSRGGLGCVVRTIKSITGIDIPYAGVVQFSGVEAVSEAVGGVPVCLAKPIHDKDTSLDLPAGINVIHGHEAAEFLRTRHGVGDGSDLDRISNQQVFLGALVRTVTSSDTLTNPAKVYGIARAVVENMTLSTSMDSATAIASIALTVKGIPTDRFTFVQYPSVRRTDGRVDPDAQAGAQLISAVTSDSDFSLAPGSIGGGVQAPKSTPAPSPSSSAGSAAAGSPDAAAPGTVLPKDVTGQTAAEETCAHG